MKSGFLMRVTVLFFGLLKDITGLPEESLELPAGSNTGTVFEHYASQYPRLRGMAGSIALARNQEFCGLKDVLEDGDEIALMPPVSGGAGAGAGAQSGERGSRWIASAAEERGFYALTEKPIETRGLVRRLLDRASGAVITFEGVVRDNSGGRKTRYLDYECYRPMALRQMRQLGNEMLERHDIRAIAVVHRLGRLAIGEASVAIVVVSAHRRAAYDASLEAIDRLKRRVPVWKKEYFEDGEVWVEGAWDAAVPRPAGNAS